MTRPLSTITRTILTLLCCFVFLIIVQFSDSFRPNVIGQSQKSDQTNGNAQDIAQEHARKTFRKGRQLLLDYGVPFEPNDLLESTNKEVLLSKLATLYEFTTTTQLSSRIKGVKIADTLYLPEKIQLDGDTVLVARNIIYEGKQIEIKGNFDLHIYPLEKTGVLGMTLTQALSKKNPGFTKVDFSSKSRMNFSSLGIPLSDEGRISIDLSGRGRKEWLEEQSRSTDRANRDEFLRRFVGASYTNDIGSAFLQTHGQPGETGQPGGVGPDGTGGNDGDNGNVGNCNSSSTIHGANGGAATVGNAPAGPGPQGGPGGPGENGGAFSTSIPDGSNTPVTINTYGGDGGQGGTGGTGGRGGRGGKGGNGGDGASCQCAIGLGNGGTGLNGRDGGLGGTGGKGGKGGKAGNGGDIAVSVPHDYNTDLITPNRNAGAVGPSGIRGTQGVGGTFGELGEGGDPGTNPSCSPSGGNPGTDGIEGQFGPNGSDGAPGDLGDTGTPGTVTYTPRDPPPPQCLSLECEECPCNNCVTGCEPPEPTCEWWYPDLECTEVCVIDPYGRPDCEIVCYQPPPIYICW